MKKMYMQAVLLLAFMLALATNAAAKDIEIKTGGVTKLVIGNGTDITTFQNGDVNVTGNLYTTNLTLTEKITFALGQMIDAIVSGWVRITQNLNVTQNLAVGGNVSVAGNIVTPGTVTATAFVGDGSGLTGVSGKFIGKTARTYNGSITNGTLTGYTAVNAICNQEYLGSHMCSTDEIINTIHLSNLSALSDWTGTAWITSGGPKYSPAPQPVNDCEGWKDKTIQRLGSFWFLDATTGGTGAASDCTASVKIACCR